MQTAKSTGMGIGCLQHLTGPEADTGITFTAAGSAITHLGISLSTDPDAAARALYTAILQRLNVRIARWSGFRLSLPGRARVAKQMLMSMFTYHDTFVPVPADILRQLCTSVYTFVAANRPAAAGAAHLFPSISVGAAASAYAGAFCDDMAAMILQVLETHPVTAQLSMGQRWVHLKRSIRLFASSRVSFCRLHATVCSHSCTIRKRFKFSFDRYHSRQVTQIFASKVFRSPTPVLTSASLQLARPPVAPYRPRSIISDHHAYSPCPH